MRKRKYCRFAAILTLALLLATMLPTAVFAAEDGYHLGTDSLVNAGKDTGYAEENPIDKDDPHWDWSLGTFYLSDYTRQIEDENGDPLFLKNAGDTVTLWFSLEQDINCLNGNEKLTIAEDKNGFDQQLGVAQQDFGRGMLIVKHTDYLNHSTVTTYRDFLAAEDSTTANTEITVLEEGDYEVALDYEIRETRLNLLGWEPLPAYHNYRISFKFSVRNGNTMIFPRDVKTGAELANETITENGFTLDLAKSRYLNIDIKKEILQEGTNGLVEDVRFNKPAQDGSQYTDEGIYTITVTNRYTDQQTTKMIYVGTNDILKAYVVTGLSLQDIQNRVAAGAVIAEDGTLIEADGTPALSKPLELEETGDTLPTVDPSEIPESSQAPDDTLASGNTGLSVLIVLGSVGLILLVAVLVFVRKHKKRSVPSEREEEES